MRAGNVIGGGDWALDRIIPDLVRAVVGRRDVTIRNPDATRPWQHVLEPLSGYLWLGAQLPFRRELRSGWNFGPADAEPRTVEQVATVLLNKWMPPSTRLIVERDPGIHESTLLRLDCSKAQHALQWHAAWDVDRTLEAIVDWYRHFYDSPKADMFAFSIRQIEEYTAAAQSQNVRWAVPRD